MDAYEGVKAAEFTFCYERRGAELRRLPWAFVQFAGTGEGRDYVMPLPPFGFQSSEGTVGLPPDNEIGAWQPYRQFSEVMENRPWPHGGPDSQGERAVHFFGGV